MTYDSKKDNISSNRLKTGLFQKILFLGFILMISLSFMQCANMQRPTGGPKDSIPPKLLNESPANLTRNFKAKEIVLTFDEYIKLASWQREFNLSPDAATSIQPKIKKKNLIITLPDSLEENTTYTINFGKGLVDYNEGNPIQNYTYVFSTGPELDSLTIEGSVLNGYTKEFDLNKDKEVIAILIPTAKDSIFGKRKASYYTAVDSSGNFKFKNLRADNYRVYAIKDLNNDKIYNVNEEWIGFQSDSIHLTQNVFGIKLEYTKGIPLIYRNLEKKVNPDGAMLLTFNRSLNNPSVKIMEPSNLDQNKIVRLNPTTDTIKVYTATMDYDSVKLQLSENNQIIDTIEFRKARGIKVDKNIVPKFNISNKVDRVKHIELTFSYPIASVDKNKIILTEDSVSRRNFQLQQDSVDKEMYHIRFNWRPNKNYELVLQEKAILGPFDEFNKESKLAFTLNEADNYGDINLNFTGLDSAMTYIVELIDEKKDKIFNVQTLPANRQLAYLKFPGGKYSLRIIEDANKNGKWDPGDVYKGKQAERLWYLDRTFTIRANWEQNETIAVDFK